MIGYLRANRLLTLDYIVGLRGCGLILYGTLPASLASLGALKVPAFETQSGSGLIPLLLLAATPTVLLYLLIRQRLKAWYLLSYALSVRSTILTFSILGLATCVCLAAGLLKGTYTIVSLQAWLALPATLKWAPLLQSLLLGLVVLVASSTLFLTAIKDQSGFTPHPSKEFTVTLSELRDALQGIQQRSIWTDREGADSADLQDHIENAQTALDRLGAHVQTKVYQGRFYREVKEHMVALETARKQIQSTPSKWDVFFPERADAQLGPDDRAIRAAVQSLREMQRDAR